VTIATSVEKTIPVQLRAIGKVQAFSTVVIKSQVDGEILSVHFTEGQEVKKGDLLFTIDPRPFEANLKRAEAQLAKDKAQLQNAKKLIERYQSVVQRGYVSQEQYDTGLANAAALEASVKADEAAVENAKLELKYCTIRAPIDGITGEIKVHQGNIIKAKDNERPMVTINQVSPVYVAFSIPEQQLPEIKRHMSSGKLGVLARVPGDETNPVQGHLAFVDNTVDPATGTIQLKATYENVGKMLWPGQFVNVVLTLTTRRGAVVIPSQAVQTGQQGQYVFVVKSDSTVEYRAVVAGKTIDHEVVIDKGIGAGEKVVTDGQLRLAQGSQVKVVEDEVAGPEGTRK
jgi:multidrug efflux system membrane fusion protein